MLIPHPRLFPIALAAALAAASAFMVLGRTSQICHLSAPACHTDTGSGVCIEVRNFAYEKRRARLLVMTEKNVDRSVKILTRNGNCWPNSWHFGVSVRQGFAERRVINRLSTRHPGDENAIVVSSTIDDIPPGVVDLPPLRQVELPHKTAQVVTLDNMPPGESIVTFSFCGSKAPPLTFVSK